MPRDTQELERIFNNHQHRGFDGSQLLALLDWKLIARNTLPVAATSLVMDGIPTRTFIRVFIQHGAKSGVGNNFLRFNNDSGSNYTFIDEGGTARTSRAEIDLIDAANNSLGYFYTIDVVNIFGSVKVMKCESLARITSAATAQSFQEIRGTWVNTTANITRVDLISSNSQTFPANSSIAIYGSNF